MIREQNLQVTDAPNMAYDAVLAPVFNYSNLAENLITFGKFKNELENQMKLKKLTPNERSLLIINQSLCDYLIEFHKAVISQKISISDKKDICPYCNQNEKYTELKCCEVCASE